MSDPVKSGQVLSTGALLLWIMYQKPFDSEQLIDTTLTIFELQNIRNNRKIKTFHFPGKKGEEPVPEPVHNSVCDVCGEGGDILLCDTCTLSWHLTCLDPPLDEVPEGTWSCPKCEVRCLYKYLW